MHSTRFAWKSGSAKSWRQPYRTVSLEHEVAKEKSLKNVYID